MKTQILIGILYNVVGIVLIFLSLRYPPKSEFGLLPTASGVIGGILFIAIGITYFVKS